MQDFNEGIASKKGYWKITKCCELARSQSYNYCWIDTCCIDKSSSSELSEAINSMFHWYREAKVCYVYLSDVSSKDALLFLLSDPSEKLLLPFRRSRWFTRGWTLQELIAPSEVIFYASNWTEIGTKEALKGPISTQTGIDVPILEGFPLQEVCVAQRMSWASRRETTRIEDQAYCLLGIFRVNMPLLYGEGWKAFIRLQQEIMKTTRDDSLFAWDWKGRRMVSSGVSGLLAPCPELFHDAKDLIVPRNTKSEPHQFSSHGVRMVLPRTMDHNGARRIGLECFQSKKVNGTALQVRVWIELHEHGEPIQGIRSYRRGPLFIPNSLSTDHSWYLRYDWNKQEIPIYVAETVLSGYDGTDLNQDIFPSLNRRYLGVKVRTRLSELGYRLSSRYPSTDWYDMNRDGTTLWLSARSMARAETKLSASEGLNCPGKVIGALLFRSEDGNRKPLLFSVKLSRLYANSLGCEFDVRTFEERDIMSHSPLDFVSSFDYFFRASHGRRTLLLDKDTDQAMYVWPREYCDFTNFWCKEITYHVAIWVASQGLNSDWDWNIENFDAGLSDMRVISSSE